ncbi:MAG: phosphatase PAP2 family protein [Candidatus Pacebacteria bacterium]|jgi:undecaprenyl-diphosphatase|nr:phosphatase PAP2 family protein [Candidatus Paceibacterota bacterium]
MNEKIFYYFFNFAHQSLLVDQLVIFLANGFSVLLMLSGVLYVMYHNEGKFSPIQNYEVFSIRMKEIFVFCSTGIFSWFTVSFLKTIFSTPRPYEILNINPLFTYGTMDSFPSGHAAVFGALAFGLLFLHRSAGSILFAILSLVVLLARIVSGIHFPIDIAGGALVGFLIAYFFHRLFRPIIYKKAISFRKH